MKEVLESLSQVRFVLGLLTGNSNKADLQKKIIAEAGATDEDGRPLKYKDLKGEDKQGCDEAVEAMQQIQGIFNDVLKMKAAMTMKFFKALREEGFTEDQALQIVSRQQINAKGE